MLIKVRQLLWMQRTKGERSNWQIELDQKKKDFDCDYIIGDNTNSTNTSAR